VHGRPHQRLVGSLEAPAGLEEGCTPMPRPRKPARLFLRKRTGRPPVFVILDGSREISTGAGPEDIGRAEEALANYCADRHAPPSGATAPKALYIDEVMTIYLREHAQHSRSREWISHMATPILDWWSGKTLGNINDKTCGDYVRWRTGQPVKQLKTGKRSVSEQSARHELSVLSAAINYFNRSKYGPFDALPVVTLPPKAPPRDNYFLTRDQIAQRVRAARRKPEWRHVVRMLLAGFYTGTRPGATLQAKWMRSASGGWFDLEAGIFYRKPQERIETTKRQPKVRIHRKLMVHLRYWKAKDLAKGITNVVHYGGDPIKTKLRRSWDSVRIAAGHEQKDTPLILRHSCATWLMQRRVSLEETADFLGMTPQMLWETYKHHHPDWQAEPAQVMPKKPMNRSGTR
jgi:integrase